MTIWVERYWGILWKGGSALLCALCVLALLFASGPGFADDDDDDDDDDGGGGGKIAEFVDDVKVKKIRKHQRRLQRAADKNNGIRASGSGGYDDSVAYVAGRLRRAGYTVELQEFQFQTFIPQGPSEMAQTAPALVTYVENTDFEVMLQSDPGDVTAPVSAVDLALAPPRASTSGCETADFVGFPAGNIALIQRGACTFRLKAENAAAAGAVGVIIFNQGNDPSREGLFTGTLSANYVGGIPVLFSTFARGEEWAATDGLTIRMFANVFRGLAPTENILAELVRRRDDDDDDDDGDDDDEGRVAPDPDGPVIVIGAHLDSVTAGPGIQDNGSGSSAILEIALQLAKQRVKTKNRIRFAWWAAEESGLIGSQFYVDSLSQDELDKIALNLNYDMIGSPNFVRFVYDGDGDAFGLPGPPGSEIIEQAFLEYFAGESLPNKPTAFDGRSDYGPFIAIGIPAGGLFTGAEQLKTAEEVAIYGGVEGEQYDQCYHLACDTFDNISLEALEQMSKAAAAITLDMADRDLPLVAPAPVAAALQVQSLQAAPVGPVARPGAIPLDSLDYLGGHLQR